ncbi:hypothetical protein C8J55DRAFT_16280 [Lentinula edodes]|uniref:Thaumatin-like protein n=2 Tax=Lentinula lateritia TaxID=40482 RepID=A0A9W9E3W0_9AGAR|nr:hypothetical protein C8J55DRAFT_16280 [Lentinula edodes]
MSLKKGIISCFCAVFLISLNLAAPISMRRGAGDHTFTLVNNCPESITAYVEDTKCGYSTRCTDASSYTAAQPGVILAGASVQVTIPASWVGRIYAETVASSCGAKGEDCTIGEFNLDTGDIYAAQAYDISNIQGYTQAMSIQLQGCDTVTCTSEDCSCSNAYPPGDETGCGDDSPVRACGAGAIPATITFCP